MRKLIKQKKLPYIPIAKARGFTATFGKSWTYNGGTRGGHGIWCKTGGVINVYDGSIYGNEQSGIGSSGGTVSVASGNMLCIIHTDLPFSFLETVLPNAAFFIVPQQLHSANTIFSFCHI